MRRILALIIVMVLALSCVACSSSSSPEKIAKEFCKAIEKGDVTILNSLIQLDSKIMTNKNILADFTLPDLGEESYYAYCDNIYTSQESFHEFGVKEYADLVEQVGFKEWCDAFSFEFGDYSVEYINYEEEIRGPSAYIEMMQLCQAEGAVIPKHVEEFFNSEEDEGSINFDLIIRDKTNKGVFKVNVSMEVYKANGRWYLDRVYTPQSRYTSESEFLSDICEPRLQYYCNLVMQGYRDLYGYEYGVDYGSGEVY